MGRVEGESGRRILWSIGKLQGQFTNDGSVIDQKDSIFIPVKYFGILQFRISKVYVLNGLMEGNYSVITCTLPLIPQVIQPDVLSNYKIRSIVYIDQNVTCH